MSIIRCEHCERSIDTDLKPSYEICERCADLLTVDVANNTSRSERRENAEKAEATRKVWPGFRNEWVLLQAAVGKHIGELESENASLREQLVVCRAAIAKAKGE